VNDNFLQRIVRQRRESIDFSADLEALRLRAEAARAGCVGHRLQSALAGEGVHVIGEFKRASPSAGLIRDDVAPAPIAQTYARAGVAAISVLTEPNYFRGSLADIEEVRRVTELPILRKDFIVHPSQIYEAALAGADAVLLIVAALNDSELSQLLMTTHRLGLDPLVEVHTAAEMERAVNCGAVLLGVNNRDLGSLQVSLDTSLQLARFAPADVILVSESGIKTADDVACLACAGYRGFLIGESLMRVADPAALIARFRHAAPGAMKLSRT
jgi:indole-3-glycerol phosphate synthase